MCIARIVVYLACVRELEANICFSWRDTEKISSEKHDRYEVAVFWKML